MNKKTLFSCKDIISLRILSFIFLFPLFIGGFNRVIFNNTLLFFKKQTKVFQVSDLSLLYRVNKKLILIFHRRTCARSSWIPWKSIFTVICFPEKFTLGWVRNRDPLRDHLVLSRVRCRHVPQPSIHVHGQLQQPWSACFSSNYF